jgi:hypothetical protein
MLWGIWAFNVLRSRMKTARKHAARLLALARRDPGGDIVIEARLAAGLTRAWLGDFPAAQRHLEAAVAEYDEQRHRAHASRYGQDPLVLGLTHLAWVHWFRGRSEAALDPAMDAIAHARRLDEPHTLAFALGYAAILRMLRDEAPQSRELAQETVALARRHEFAQWSAFGRFILGWVTARQGEDRERGHVEMTAAIGAYRTTGAEWGEAFFLALLATPLLDHPDSRDAAGRALDAAMLSLEAKDERFFASSPRAPCGPDRRPRAGGAASSAGAGARRGARCRPVSRTCRAGHRSPERAAAGAPGRAPRGFAGGCP